VPGSGDPSDVEKTPSPPRADGITRGDSTTVPRVPNRGNFVMGIIRIPQYNQAMEPTHSTTQSSWTIIPSILNISIVTILFPRVRIERILYYKTTTKERFIFGVKALRQHSVQGCDDLAHDPITCACQDHTNSTAGNMEQHVNNSS
jgi:hypothetical protein